MRRRVEIEHDERGHEPERGEDGIFGCETWSAAGREGPTRQTGGITRRDLRPLTPERGPHCEVTSDWMGKNFEGQRRKCSSA